MHCEYVTAEARLISACMYIYEHNCCAQHFQGNTLGSPIINGNIFLSNKHVHVFTFMLSE